MGPGALGLALEVVPPAPAPAAGTTALAPGFRFHPTDEELVGYYLKRKVHGKGFHIEAIAEVDIYKSEPWELADKSMLKSKDQEWYFFSALDKKYGNGARMNRATNNGYWKATGNDRAIRNNSNLVGMKKTLVFHSGRAPDGKRTDWVMHEYRLVDEELEKMGAMQKDSYVLCRVFLKNGLGPPKKHRYAPFVEEEWDNGAGTLVPGEVVGDEVAAGDESNDVEEDTQSINEAAHCLADLRKDSKAVLHICKRERLNGCPLTCEMNQEAASPCMLNREASPPCNANRESAAPLLQYKRRRHGDLDLNNSNAALTRTIQNPCFSTTATPAAATTTSSATTPPNLPSALLEFSLLDTIQHKESTSDPPPIFSVADLDSSVPSSCWTFINSLLTEVQKISFERETLKVKLMSAHGMIKFLQSQMESFKKENGDLKRIIEDVSK